MGTIVEYRRMPDRRMVYRLVVYCAPPEAEALKAVSINRPLAEKLILYEPGRRTMRLEKCFVKLLEELPDQPVIKDIDVMFHPEYRVDVMKMLVLAYKRRPYSLIWPGSCSGGRLIYSEEGLPDYRVYDVADYDIMCVVEREETKR